MFDVFRVVNWNIYQKSTLLRTSGDSEKVSRYAQPLLCTQNVSDYNIYNIMIHFTLFSSSLQRLDVIMLMLQNQLMIQQLSQFIREYQ